eukprot:UN12375
MGKTKTPSGVKGEKNYDIDYDVEYEYHDEWKGLIYDKEDEIKMKHVMATTMPTQAQVFATKNTYLYYTRYYAMLNRMDEIRREKMLANINKSIEDPMKFKDLFVSGSMNFGFINASLGIGAIAGMIYALRFIR